MRSLSNSVSSAKVLHLHSFQSFSNTIESTDAIRKLQGSQLHSSLKDFLQTNVREERLQVSDPALAKAIQLE
jgi:hypothetical protein